MNVYLNEITGIADAITSMFMSKRSWTKEKEDHVRDVCDSVLNKNGSLRSTNEIIQSGNLSKLEDFNGWMDSLVKWGWKHTTMLRFIDMSMTVEGLHRAGQDDWDAHAKRFNNRIIRSSTRLATFGDEVSEWYSDKIVSTDVAMKTLGMDLPQTVQIDGSTYVKSVNGYVHEDFKEDLDVKRGLYMLSIPSNFIFKVDLAEWAHVYKERNINGTANPEVKRLCELIADHIESFHGQFNREFFMKIKN
ncbi:MAG: hypothetical protein FWE29_01710 [Defluviitaleaceae bacterium]|nr:hypothetical protein [Defluviitaleaceae bacterium]